MIKTKGVLRGLVCQNHLRLQNTLGVVVSISKVPMKFKKYGVRREKSRVFMVHFESNQYKSEDISDEKFLLNKPVLIASCTPKSKHKRFMLLNKEEK